MTAAHAGPDRVLHDVTVLVPTVGRALLRDCLASVFAGSHWPAAVIIVDQGRDAQAAAAATAGLGPAAERVTVVRSAQRGAAAARNRGLERVATRFVAALDDDCVAEREWLVRLTTELRRDPATVVTGRVTADGGGLALSTVSSGTPVVHRRPLLRADPFCAGNMGCAMAVVARVGLFDENPGLVAAAEDNEWSYRALCAGVPVAYVPGAVVRHRPWRDATERSGRYADYARGQGAFYGKYIRRGDTFIARRAAYDLARGCWMWLRGGATRDADLAAYGRAYVTELVPGVVAGLRGEGKA